MSRSYKKYPKVKCGGMGRYGKKLANKKLRNIPIQVEIPNHNQFRKMFESCEIYDYSFTQFREWVEVEWYKDQAEIINNVSPYKANYNTTLEEALNNWYTFYKIK